MARPDVRDDTALVDAVRNGDRDAFGILFERWFDRVYDVARNIVRSPETAADVAQDTFVTAWERIGTLDRADAFGGWLLRISRNRALDRLEREGRSTSQDSDVVTGLHDRGTPDLVGSRRELDVEEITATRDRDALVHAAAVALGERDASLLDLQLRHGLSPAEIAEELGVTPNNAHQLLFRMRAKLGDAVGAVVLWRRGNPACPDLAFLLAGAEDTFDRATFDRATFELVERHRRQCDLCADRRAALLAPEQLFSAAPILIAPALIKAGVVERLGSLGINVGESALGVGGPTPSEGIGSADSSGGPDPTATSATAPMDPPSNTAADPPIAGGRQHDGGVPPGTAVGGAAPTDPWAAPKVPLEPTAVASIVGGDDPAGDPALTDNSVFTGDPADDDRRSRRRALLLIAASILVVAGIVGTAVVASRSAGDRDAELASPAASTSPGDGPTTTRGGGLTASTPAPQQRSGTTAPGLATATTIAATTTTPPPPDTTTPVATTIAAAPLPPAPTAPPTTRRPTTTRPTTSPPPPTVAPTVPPVAEPPPPAPETTAPPPPPTTAAPVPTTTAPPAPPPPPPDVVRFYFGTVPPGLLCADPAQGPRRFMWTSTNAASAQLVVAGIARNVAVTGGYNTCAAAGDVATITVSGPGGADSATLTVP